MMTMTTTNIDQSSNDDDGSSRPDSNQTPAIVGGNKKLKIVLSSLAQQTNLTNKQNISNFNNNNNHNNVVVINEQNSDASSNLEIVNKLDSNSLVDLHKQGAAAAGSGGGISGENQGDVDEVREDDKEIEFEIKPHLRDIKFEMNSVPVKRGFDNSGLCSIM